MPICPRCNTWLEVNEEVCPICGATKYDIEPKVVEEVKRGEDEMAETAKTRQEAIVEPSMTDEDKTLREINRQYQRGLECMDAGRKWHAMKNKTQSRREFQRAIKYFERVLKLDPEYKEARVNRDKCLHKII